MNYEAPFVRVIWRLLVMYYDIELTSREIHFALRLVDVPCNIDQVRSAVGILYRRGKVDRWRTTQPGGPMAYQICRPPRRTIESISYESSGVRMS